MTEEEANEMGLKFIRARWEHQQRAGADSKWRYVAQEFAWQEQRDDCFAASSTGQTARTIDFLALKEGWATFGADCVKAYYQAKQKENVCVRPPAEYIEMLAQAGRRTDVVWRLHRMLRVRAGSTTRVSACRTRASTGARLCRSSFGARRAAS